MGSIGQQRQQSLSTKVVDFGNAPYKEQIVTYNGVKMPRKDALRINKLKDDIDYFAYKRAKAPLTEKENQEKELLQNELRAYGDKYGIPVGWYVGKKKG